MYHSVKVIPIFQIGFIKADQQQIIKVTGLFLELGNDGNFQFFFSRELIAKQGLCGNCSFLRSLKYLLQAVRNTSFY